MRVGASDLEIAWLAGLFEGEGSLIRKPNQGVQMVIGMTDEDVILKAQAIAGGTVRPIFYPKNPERKQAWKWAVSNWPEVLALINLMLPYMGQRRGGKMRAILAEAASNGRWKGSWVPCDHDLGISEAGYNWHRKHTLMPVCERCMQSYRLYQRRYQLAHRDRLLAYYRARYRARQQLLS
jgi:hypothetical protein